MMPLNVVVGMREIIVGYFYVRDMIVVKNVVVQMVNVHVHRALH
tara:strand:+ start:591 stop:722 length:132 start_codon:yes stop_codon:yes gene_type:complete